jgi:hypothetical protein
MLTKIAGFVLVGSVVTLAGVGIADLAGFELNDSHRVRMRIEREVAHGREHRGRDRQHRRRVEVEREVQQVIGNNAQVEGTYRFDADGKLLNKLESGATVKLQLEPGGRYELKVLIKADGQSEEETSWGRYSVRGNRLVLSSNHDVERHELTIDGDHLVFDVDWTERLALKALGVENAFMTKVQQ